MNAFPVKIFPLGESALTVEFANEISPEINNKVVTLATYLENNQFAGFIEMIPAYASLTVFYDISIVIKNFPEHFSAFNAVKSLILNALQNTTETIAQKSRQIEIPVRFDLKNEFDLKHVAETNNLETNEVIEIFTAPTYRVYMLGFLPGFAYMGEVDERIATPRKNTPRTKTPKGSVGIAGKQTGIYPFESPGGWQIIGVTEIELFTPESETPTFLQPGDTVKFYRQN